MSKEEKVRKKKRRRKKHYLLKFILIIIFGIGIYFFLTSNLFDIQKIIVENNSYYTSEQIIGIAKAAVLPVPVCAQPIRSCFFKMSGMACSCIGVGFS